MEFARGKLMVASFLTLVACGFGFAARTVAGGPWEREFNIGGTDFGNILGAGFLGFGLMIFFGGILVERFGYKSLLFLALLLHLLSAGMLFAANPLFDGWRESNPESATSNVYWVLFSSAFIFSIAQGIYESVINPLIADLYPENKTHYLNVLHAGWPAGMILGGLVGAGFIGENCWFVELPWAVALASFAVIVLVVLAMVLFERFPETVSEATTGSFFAVFACFLSIPFLVLIVMHAMIGYMELGVDSWMTKIMETLLPNSIIILVYTSALMFILRFFAGPIVHRINPIGLLLGSSVIAFLGLRWLGSPIESVAVIFAAATFYSFGKAFLWPTMLAVAGERYPRSGSVAMGALGAAGMICVGQVGNSRLGAQQGQAMSDKLQQTSTETFNRYAVPATDSNTVPKPWYQSPYWPYAFQEIEAAKLNAANATDTVDGKVADTSAFDDATLIPEDEKTVLISHASEDVPAVKSAYRYGGQRAFTLTSYLPGMMAIGFLGLLIYYRAIGGYKVIVREPTGSGDGGDPTE